MKLSLLHVYSRKYVKKKRIPIHIDVSAGNKMTFTERARPQKISDVSGVIF